jgi:HSP20 family protein
MSEVAVKKQATQETAVPARWLGFEAPLFRGSLFGLNPFALMRQFTEDMDRTFGQIPNGSAAWRPAIEVKQEKDKLVVTAELPGLKKENVNLNIVEGVLTLQGERKQEKEEKREGYVHSERSYGKFLRSIALPEGAKIDQAAAQFKDGVLEITIPVVEAKPAGRQIPIH